MKRFIALIMAAAMLFTLAACGNADESMEEVLDKKAVIMGYDKNYLPMGFVDDNGTYTGFDIDLAKAICKNIVTPSGVSATLNIMPISGDEGVSGLASGAIDFLGNSVTALGEGALDYSETIFESRYVIAAASSDIAEKADLEGKNVAVVPNSAAAEALAGDSSFSSKITVVDAADEKAAVAALKANEVSAIVMDELAVKYFVNKGETLTVLDGDLGSQEYRLVFSKNSKALLKEVNRILKLLNEDGTLEELSIKWFGENIVALK